MKTRARLLLTSVCFQFVLLPSLVFSQSKPLREIKVGYPLGGSSSYFWVAYRSGAFEKHGLKLEPIYIRGGLMGIQAALSGDLLLQLQGASTVVAAWAKGAKEFQFIGAVGNRLDYILAAHPSIKRPEDLKGKRIGVSQLGSSTDFIARVAARRLGLNPEKDVQIVGIGGQGDRWTALTAGQVQATVLQSPFTLKARKAGYPTFIDFSKEDFEYTIAGPVTTRSFIRAERETVMNFMRGLADGMDFYRDEKNKDRVIKYLGEYYRSNVVEELEETRRVYSQVTPGLPLITVKAMENVIANDKNLADMNFNVAELLDLSFLEKLAQEKKNENTLNGIDMDFQNILFDVRHQIAFVTFNRPESMNAVNRQMAQELVDACNQIESDSAIRLAIFSGAGDKAFSAGMDLKERSETPVSPIERRQQKLSATINTQTRAVAAITKPTIAAIRGYCVGGGLEFALACDMRVAAEDAKLGLAEVKRGLIPGAGGTQRLARTVGVAKALEICLTGDSVSGSEAERLGLVNIAVPAGDVMKAAEDLANRVLKGAPMSVLLIKEAIKKGVELSLDEGFRLESDLSALIATTDDSKEGPRAFAEKRAPVWKGR